MGVAIVGDGVLALSNTNAPLWQGASLAGTVPPLFASNPSDWVLGTIMSFLGNALVPCIKVITAVTPLYLADA